MNVSMSLQNTDDNGQTQNKCKTVSGSFPQQVHISSTSANVEIDLLQTFKKNLSVSQLLLPSNLV